MTDITPNPNDPPDVRALLKRLSHERFSTRLNAALELAEMEDERAIPVLLEAAAGEDEDLSEVAFEAIALITGPTGLVVEEDDDLLVVSGEAAVPYWIDMLYMEEQEIVQSAIEMLELIGTAEAINALKEWDASFDDTEDEEGE